VHSMILMMVSLVFRQMLCLEMGERFNRVVELPDKKKDEFRVFCEVLQPMSTTQIGCNSAVLLSRWADEYGVEVLKAKCEDVVIKNMPIDIQSWQHAITHNLEGRAKQCADDILKDPVPPQSQSRFSRDGM
jgi:hypothetical protein